MKDKLVLLAIFLLSHCVINAQDDQLDELSFEEQNYEQFVEESTPYFVIGGGPVMNMMFLNFDDINSSLINKFFKGNTDVNLDGNFYQFGAQGMISVGLIPNIRIGVLGLGGSKSPENPMDTTINNIQYSRYFDYSLGYTGINIDYAWVPFTGFKFAIVPGVTLGWGTINIENYQTQKEIEFTDIKPETDNLNYYMKLESSYWHVAPMLSFEYSPTFLSLFRASVGYTMSFPGTWNINSNEDSNVKNVPTGINSNGLTFQFGIILGIFNY
ncbi:MAG: hypothetical protein V1779_11860 [bacterium]